MKIGDFLYFAPGVRFGEVDLDGHKFPEQFGRRIDGFYIEPAEECAKCGYAFAAGVLLVTCIDALARLRSGGGVGERFCRFAGKELHSFGDRELAKRFYEEFRNGLVHEGRLKKGGQFSLETGATVEQTGEILLVNPKYLANEVRAALRSYLAILECDEGERVRLADALRNDLAEDFSCC
jgi:hypothetical protein